MNSEINECLRLISEAVTEDTHNYHTGSTIQLHEWIAEGRPCLWVEKEERNNGELRVWYDITRGAYALITPDGCTVGKVGDDFLYCGDYMLVITGNSYKIYEEI